MNAAYLVLFLSSSLPASGLLRKKPPLEAMSKCPQRVNQSMWGIWVDGRDAQKGPTGYGKKYHEDVMVALQHAYGQASQQEVIDMKFFTSIKKKMGAIWRQYTNPIYKEVRTCHKELPPAQLKEIMSTVSVLDEQYCPARSLTGAQYENRLIKVFDDYANEVRPNPGRAKEVLALAKLLQNLAYLHPLADENGRSRLAVTNYVLRQRGLACGTMMHNNNKNIYFESVETIAAKIEEGIEVYEKALATNFAENPWQAAGAQEKHFARFPKPTFMAKVETCWAANIGGGAKGSSPAFKNVDATEMDDCPTRA